MGFGGCKVTPAHFPPFILGEIVRAGSSATDKPVGLLAEPVVRTGCKGRLSEPVVRPGLVTAAIDTG